MRGGRGAAVASSIKEVIAVTIYTPPLMALQQVSASVFGVGITVRLFAPRVCWTPLSFAVASSY